MIGHNHLGKNGRFGNQMFQYAVTRGIAAKHNYDWCIPDGPKTDEDIALRVCKFLEIKKPYKITRIRKDGTKKEYIADHYKDMYEITKTGGCKSGFLFNLYQKMYPHLSLHRREQIDNTYKRAIERLKL